MDSLLKARRRFILKYLSTLLRFATIVILVFQVASEPPSSKRFHLEEDCHIASSVLYSMMTKSLARCALLCHLQNDCVAYGYEPESGLCRTSSAFELLPGYCQCERPMLVGEDIYVSEEALSEYHKERVCKISELRPHARPDSINCIQPDALTSRGEWGPDDWCPNGTYATGVMLQVEADQYLSDDTALNAVRLICSMHCPGPTFCEMKLVESSTGPWGSWAQQQPCPNNHFISGGSVRSEMYKEGTDIVGATNYNFKCQSISDAAAGNRVGEAFGWGSWSGWESCPNGSYVCGLRTQVEPFQGLFADDSALNDAIFYCCNFTHVW